MVKERPLSSIYIIDPEACVRQAFFLKKIEGLHAAFTKGAKICMIQIRETMNELMLTPEQLQAGGFWISLGIAYLGGLAIALTPCVYPLIPITLGIMGTREFSSRWGAFFLSAVFVLGIALVYALLGVLASSSGVAMGGMTQQPWVVALIASLFAVLGLGLLGLYNIQLPGGFMNWLSKKGGKGFGGVFVLGMASGVLAAPCSGPVSVGILAFVAQGSNIMAGFLVLFIYGLGIGTPFLILGTFSNLLAKVPKSGVWTVWVKSFCGLALLLAALLFGKAYLSEFQLFLLVAIIFLGVCIYFPKIFPLPSEKFRFVFVGIRALLVVLAIFVTALGWHQTYSVPSNQAVNSAFWHSEEAPALAAARELQKPVIVDFWARWCEACVELEHETFSNPRVRAKLEKDFIGLRLDVSDFTGEKSQNLLEKYGILGMPTVLFLRPSGYIEKSLSVTGFLDADEFLAHLRKVKAKGL